MEWSILSSFHLGIMITQVLLQIAELDESATAIGKVTFIGTFA